MGCVTRAAVGAVLFALAVTPAASAAETAPDPALMTVLAAPQQRQAAIDTARNSTAWVRHGCTTGEFSNLSVTHVWRPLQYDATGAPVGGLWQESVIARGCGIERRLNVYGEVVGPRQIRWRLLAPVTTLANPKLQQDASHYVFVSALMVVKGCQDAYLDQTELLDRESVTEPGATAPALRERWTVVACGQSIPIAVTFIPDATGVQIVTNREEPRAAAEAAGAGAGASQPKP